MNNENPIQMLTHEHKYILKVVHALSVIDDELKQGKKPNMELMYNIVHFMREFADKCHHAKEEAILFPAMEHKGVPKTGCPLSALRAEHVQGRKLVTDFESAIASCDEGDPGAIEKMRKAISGIRQLYPNHIWKEDEMVFPMAVRLFSKEELADMAGDFENAEKEFGKDHEYYKTLANEMEKLHE